jgi:hypothetical protein
MLHSFVAVENLPRLQSVLTRNDASGFKGFKASVGNSGPKIDEVIFLVGIRHCCLSQCHGFASGWLPGRAIAAK